MSKKNRSKYPKIAQLKTESLFKQHLKEINAELPFSDEVESGAASVFSETITLRSGSKIGNR
ncbi:MAG: hypothetical protein ACI9QN_002787, partial [Arcticibacterium sp.]